MTKIQPRPFLPDYAVPPGETIEEELRAIGMTPTELAFSLGLMEAQIMDIIQAKAAITPEFAVGLERALGVPASFWNNLERQYREALVRLGG